MEINMENTNQEYERYQEARKKAIPMLINNTK